MALGLEGAIDYQGYSFKITPQYGLNTNVHDQDIHVLRGITFSEDLGLKEKSTYLALDLKASKHISEVIDVYAVYSYENHLESKGDVSACDAYSCYFFGDAAGAGLKSHGLMVGMTIKD